MNDKLKAWLDSLEPNDRAKVIELLPGELTQAPEEDKIISAARKAAGLPPEAPAVDPIRKAAGLK